jgi:hypothetical protein
MKNWIMALMFGLVMAFGVSANAQTVKVPEEQRSSWRGKSIDDYYRYVGPDIDIQAGVGYHFDTFSKSKDDALGIGRLRVGALYVPKYPWALSAGITVEPNTLSAVVWGTQVEAMHFASGFWLRGGVGADYYVRPHFNAALGYSLFGVEVQGFSQGDIAPNRFGNQREGIALLGVVRIPIGFILYVFDKK